VLLAGVIGIEMRDPGRGHQHQVHFSAGGERSVAERVEAERTEQVGDAGLRGGGHRRSLRQPNGMALLRRLPNARRPCAAIGDAVELGDRHRAGFRVIFLRDADLDGLTGCDRLQALLEFLCQQEPEI
jgi:hypothetical protein